jgi:prepilin-type N-terminal cleavage/methylation domain-containing protein
MRHGFSLIELSLVIVIIAVVIGGSLSMGPVLITHTEYRVSDQKLEELSKALTQYYEQNDRLPCPARNDIAADDADYGREILWDGAGTSCANDTTVPSGTVRVKSSSSPDIWVRIGAIPTRDLRLSDEFISDEFNNHITYAVMEELSDNATFPKATADITVQDGSGDVILSDAAFVLISHGDDGRGAIGTNGTTSPLACSGSPLDVENCDNDATFVDARLVRDADANNYFDDIVHWSDKDTIIYSKTVRWKEKLGELPTHCRVTSQTKIFPNDIDANDNFAIALAMDGDSAVISSRADDDVASAAGAIYVYACKSDGGWVQQAKLVADDGAASDLLGHSVAISGNRIVAGALRDDLDIGGVTINNAGGAYVYVRKGNTWVQEAKLIANDAAASDEFARSVAIDGDTILVGARYDDDSGGNSGSAYVFERVGGSWNQIAPKIIPSDAAFGDQFAYDVALDGHTAAITAHGYDTTALETPPSSIGNAGGAYIFKRTSSGWVEQAKLLASDASTSLQLGYSIDVHGDSVIVGAPLDNGSTGSAYVFHWDGSSWTQQQKLTASDGAASEQFGIEVQIDGDTALVGAYLADDGADTDAGKAYFFTRSGGVWTEHASSPITASDGGANKGFSLGLALGSNYGLIGAYADDEHLANGGAAYAQPLP